MGLIGLNRESIETSIEQLKRIDLSTISIEEIENIINPLLTGYQVIAPQLDPGLLIYRGRICSKPFNYSELIYPKSQYISKYGRANDISIPMFYAGIGKATPLLEINAQTNDTVVLTRWISKNKIFLNHVGFSKSSKYRLKSKRDLDKIYTFLRDINNFGDLNSFVHNYLASKYIEDISENENYKYKISIAITNKLLKGPFDGIIYPSIKSQGNADNIVLKPEVVDAQLQLVSVEFLKINSRSGNLFNIELLDTATEIEQDGTIIWSGRHLSISNKVFSASYENDEILSRDSNGNFIFPTAQGDIIRPITPTMSAFKKAMPNSHKISKEISYSTNGITYFPIIQIVYPLKTKKSYICLYLPIMADILTVIDNFLEDHNSLPQIFDDISLTVKEKQTNKVAFNQIDYKLDNIVKIFSEQNIDLFEISKKFSNLNLIVCKI